MSKNVVHQKLENHFAHGLNQLDREQTALRSLQPQGSNALRVGWVTLYMIFPVPDGTVVPYYTNIWFESDDPDDFVIATLINSTYLKYTDNTYANVDLESHEVGDDVWNIWMTYDSREFNDTFQVDYSPSGTFFDRLHSELAGLSLPLNKAQFGIRVNRLNSDAKPSTHANYVMVIQLRIVIGESS